MNFLSEQIETARRVSTLGASGRIRSLRGMTVEATGLLGAGVGSLCEIDLGNGRTIRSEVIGFRRGVSLLMPLEEADGLSPDQSVRHVTSLQRVPVGPALIGRVVNAMGEACDGDAAISVDTYYPLHRNAPDAMRRPRIDTPISVGIRSINALATVGGGQRIGIFSGTGVGKSILLGMMARYTSADVTVIALIGERGRELRDFIGRDLGEEGLKKSVIVTSTSDQSPPMRLRAGFTATAIAEYFRDQGANVLLLVDSITRSAMAARQIGLAAGDPPATKGYPPSVFAMLPRLLERSGRTETGSITGIYTVLVEADDINEPISDAVRGILDGHIVLSRRLGNRGHYPAVSVLESISRVMPEVVTPDHLQAAQRIKRLLAVWEEIEDLVNIGAYASGSNPEYDLVIRMRPAIEAFLKQTMDRGVDFDSSRSELMSLMSAIDKEEAVLAREKGKGEGPSAGLRASQPVVKEGSQR